MKLHEIPRNSKIYVETDEGSIYIVFHHLDGMYSYCETEEGAPVHLSANVELVEYKDGFKIKEEIS